MDEKGFVRQTRPPEGIEPLSPPYIPITDDRRVYRYDATSIVDGGVHCAVQTSESSLSYSTVRKACG